MRLRRNPKHSLVIRQARKIDLPHLLRRSLAISMANMWANSFYFLGKHLCVVFYIYIYTHWKQVSHCVPWGTVVFATRRSDVVICINQEREVALSRVSAHTYTNTFSCYTLDMCTPGHLTPISFTIATSWAV